MNLKNPGKSLVATSPRGFCPGGRLIFFEAGDSLAVSTFETLYGTSDEPSRTWNRERRKVELGRGN